MPQDKTAMPPDNTQVLLQTLRQEIQHLIQELEIVQRKGGWENLATESEIAKSLGNGLRTIQELIAITSQLDRVNYLENIDFLQQPPYTD